MAGEPTYEVFAVRYAELTRVAGENFISADPHDAPMDMDFYVWAVVGPERSYVVDTGFEAAVAQRRGRALLRNPPDGLKLVGVDPAAVKDVIVTHLHYDHVGNYHQFPNAQFHLQDKEMNFATGRHMCHHPFAVAYEANEVCGMVRQVFAGRVDFHDGDAELAPGLSVHLIGGHTMGLQAVRVRTRRGWVVLASDASHYYANMEQKNPFPIVYNVAEMIEGYRRLYELADSRAHVIPGHDPLVLKRYPAVSKDLEGIACRLDADPA